MYIHKASLEDFQQGKIPSDFTLDQQLADHFTRYSQVEPHIQAFIDEENHTVRMKREAAHLKQTYRGKTKPPLYGIPVAIKDLIHVDGWLTRAGSALPPKELTGEEGTLVKELRKKGALIAGKTVTEEFAYSSPIPTRNPHHLEHSPGGSSAGSAAAVAAGICPLGIGTQTLLSVIAPASFCGVVGFKPSYGRIPIDGVFPLSPSYDTIGFFTQDLDSMEYAASHLVLGWKPFRSDRKPILGIPNGIYMDLMFDEAKHTFKDQKQRLEEAGIIIKLVDMPWEDDFIYGNSMLRLVQGEMAEVHSSLFEKYSDLYGETVRQAILTGQTIESEQLDKYRKKQIELRHALSDLQRKERIDLWVSPSQAGPAPKWGGGTGWGGMNQIWSFMGCPAVSIPSAKINNMPIGFQCIVAMETMRR